jgi:hypothetical protein
MDRQILGAFSWLALAWESLKPAISRLPLKRFRFGFLFVICAFAYLMAFALNHLCAPKFEPARLDQ